MSSRRFLLATLIIVAVILHGSLYPYHFKVPPEGIGAVATLLASWKDLGKSYGDIVANILLYMPFGFLIALTIRRGRIGRVLVATVVGMALCTGIELAQYYDVGRVDNMSDVYFNTLGSALGATAAVVIGRLARHLPAADVAGKPVPVLLLVAMLGYHLFPYVPTIDLHKYWVALRPLIIAPRLPPYDVLRYAALWLTANCLIGSIVGYARSRVVAPLFMAAVFAAKVAITNLIVTPAEAIGAPLALLLWLAVGRHRRFAMVLTAAVLCASIVIGRLQPLHFLPTARAFAWLPFRGFLHGSIRIGTMALMEKFFLYGSLIWLAAETLMPLWLATLLVALLLFATSLAETYLPGRSAEITDAVMALIIGLVILPFREQVRPHRRPAGTGRGRQ
ncbi:MAG TPA: VanZ family protein [Stellaceae bacterium]|nr:VanZ family protein [Stellaceae bacterium]